MSNYKTGFFISIIVNLILSGIVIWLGLKTAHQCPFCPGGGGGGGGRGICGKWTIEVPPPLTKQVNVYCSSGLFNFQDILWTSGIDFLMSVKGAEYTPDVYNVLPELDAYQSWLKIPKTGLMGLCAEKGWDSYVPIRDGFLMALFLGNVAQWNADNPGKIPPVPGSSITAQQWAMVGAYMGQAVYGFDCYNLISRCNACIMNADGIGMDDGSCVEVGMTTARGQPFVYYRTQNTSNWGYKIINPMISGPAESGRAANDAYDAVAMLEVLIKDYISNGNYKYVPGVAPPAVYQKLAKVGETVWKWKFAKHKLLPSGQLAPGSLSAEWVSLMSDTKYGMAKVAAKICQIISDVQK